MRIMGVDLAATGVSGWVVLDTERMAVTAHGTLRPQMVWGPAVAFELKGWWQGIVVANHVSHVAYEVPGWAGQSSGSSLVARRKLAQAEVMLWYGCWGCSPRAWDQAEVKEQIAGSRIASKEAVKVALILREQDGEFSAEGLATWTLDETDALAVALCEAKRLRMEELSGG